MWPAFKLLSLKAKAGIIAGLVAVLLVIVAATSYVTYNKGAAISKAEISKYETESSRLRGELATAQGKADVQVVTQYKDRVSYIDRVVYKTRDVIRDNVPEQHELSKGWIYAYNQSVAGNEPEAVLAADSVGSGISDRSALGAIAENNGICLSNKAQLDALQNWIVMTEVAREEAVRSSR